MPVNESLIQWDDVPIETVKPQVQGRLSSALSDLGRGVSEGIGQGLQGMVRHAEMTGGIDPGTMTPEEREASIRGSQAFRLGSAVRSGGQRAFVPNPEYAREFWSGTVPRALGSTVSSAALSVLGGPRLGRILGPVAYGFQSGQQGVEEAQAAGRPDLADSAFAGYGLAGAATERLLGVGPNLNKLLFKAPTSVSPARRFAFNTLGLSAREAAQEGSEQMLQNVVAKGTFDPSRPLMHGVPESTVLGGLVGASFAAPFTAIEATRPQPPPVQPPPIPEPTQTGFGNMLPLRGGGPETARPFQFGGMPIQEDYFARRQRLAQGVDVLPPEIKAPVQPPPIPVSYERFGGLSRYKQPAQKQTQTPQQQPSGQSDFDIIGKAWGVGARALTENNLAEKGYVDLEKPAAQKLFEKQYPDFIVEELPGGIKRYRLPAQKKTEGIANAITEQVAATDDVRKTPQVGEEVVQEVRGAQEPAGAQEQAEKVLEEPRAAIARLPVDLQAPDGSTVKGEFTGYYDLTPLGKPPIPSIGYPMPDGTTSHGMLREGWKVLSKIPTFEEWNSGEKKPGALVTSNGVLTPPGEPMAAITAHHGTPHTIKGKFSTEKIGTGEGAQVYGWGLYFAENPEVSKNYAETLGRKKGKTRVPFITSKYGSSTRIETDTQRRAADLLQRLKNVGRFAAENSIQSEPKDVQDEFWKHFNDFDDVSYRDMTGGNEYTVSINAEPEELLDWDKPLSEQSDVVKAALLSAIAKTPSAKLAIEKTLGYKNDLEFAPGEAFYKSLGDIGGRGNKNASALLSSLGIKGIRYLDQGSRQSGKGTYNYVIFDGNDIQITHENGKPVTYEEAMAALGRTAPSGIEGRVASSTGIDSIRQLVSDPASGLPPQVSQAITALLNNPVFQNADWSNLQVQIQDFIQRGVVADTFRNLIRLSRGVEPRQAVEEFFHVATSLLPQPQLDLLEKLRNQEIDKIQASGKITPEVAATLKSGLTSQQFLGSHLPTSLYRYSNLHEYFAHVGSENFTTSLFEKTQQGVITKLVRAVKDWISALGDWWRTVTNGDKTVDQIARELVAGKYTGVPGGVSETRMVGMKQTETPEFKAWFGDSKVVDKDGKPLVVYHGTISEEPIDVFNQKGDVGYRKNLDWTVTDNGIFFSARPKVAESYMVPGDKKGPRDTYPYSGAMYPVFLSIKNPIQIRPILKDNRGTGKYELLLNGKVIKTFTDKENDPNGIWLQPEIITDKTLAYYKSLGADGMIMDPGQPYAEYTVFSPTQIKSATGNVGTFDPNNPDIRFSLKSDLENKDLEAANKVQYDKNVEMAAAAEVQVQGPVRDTINWMLDVAGIPRKSLSPDDKIVYDTVKKTLAKLNYTFAGPMSRIRAAAAKLGKPLEDYAQYQAGEHTPEEKSHVAGLAVEQLEKFEEKVQSFREGYEKKMAKLQESLDKVSEAKAESLTYKEIVNSIWNDLRDMGREMIRQEVDVAGIAAWKKASINRKASKNVLNFITSHMAPEVAAVRSGGITTIPDFVAAMKAKAAPMMTGGKTFDMVVGAGSDAVNSVARFVLFSEPIQQRILDGNAVMTSKAASGAASKFKTRLTELIQKRHYKAALREFEYGIGKTAAEKEYSRKVAQFFAQQEKKLLLEITAFENVNELFDAQTQSAAFRNLSKQVYQDIGVREVISQTGERSHALLPIYKEDEPVVISAGLNMEDHKTFMKKVHAWFARADQYLADETHPEWNASRAAAIRQAKRYASWWNDRSLNQEVEHFIPNPIVKIAGMVPLIQMPKFALKYAAGILGKMAQKDMSLYDTVSELTVSIHNDFVRPRIYPALHKAMKDHGIKNVEDYRNLVYDPISATQEFESAYRKDVGSSLGNGHVVTENDMAVVRVGMDYYHALVNRLSKTAEDNPAYDAEAKPDKKKAFNLTEKDTGGIEYIDKSGKLKIRLPFAQGYYTIPRRISSISIPFRGWLVKSADAKEKVLNENLEKMLVAYVHGAREESKLKLKYAYRESMKDIMAEHESNTGMEIGSFQNLVDRIVEKESEADESKTITPSQVRNQILSELDVIAKRVGEETVNFQKENSIVEVSGGKSEFTTPRGSQILPSRMYDYGALTDPEFSSIIQSARFPFFKRYLQSVTVFNDALKAELTRLKLLEAKTGETQRSIAKKEVKSGDAIYEYGELLFLHNQMTQLINHIKTIDNNLNRAQTMEASGDLRGINTLFGSAIVSAMFNPPTQIMNSFGGALMGMLRDLSVRNQNAVFVAVKNIADAAPRVLHDIAGAMFREKLGEKELKLAAELKKVANDPIFGKLVEVMHNWLVYNANSYQRGVDLGIHLNKHLGAHLQSLRDFNDTAGSSVATVSPIMMKRMINRFESLVRRANLRMGQASVGFVDARINLKAIPAAESHLRDLESRAQKYFAARESLAAGTGKDIYDLNDPSNFLTPMELVGGNTWIAKTWAKKFGGANAAALRLRQEFEMDTGVNIDKAMGDYYRAWKEAKSREVSEGVESGTYTDQVRLLNDSQFNQMVMAIAAYTNLATYGRSLAASQSGPVGRILSTFWRYTLFAFHQITGLMDRTSKGGAVAGYGRNIPLMISAALLMAAFGALGVASAEKARRIFYGVSGRFPTLFTMNDWKEFPSVLINGFASMYPIIGSLINNANNTAFKNGFDLNNSFLAINMMTDFANMLTQWYQTGDPLFAMTKFIARYIPIYRMSEQFLPYVEGIKKVSDATNLIDKGSRDSGLIKLLRKPMGATVQYTPASPILNRAMNAVGKGDFTGFQTAFNDLVEYYKTNGSPDPEASARAGLQYKNPVISVFGSKPSSADFSQILGSLSPDERNRVESVLQNYEKMMGSVGANATFTSEPRTAAAAPGSAWTGQPIASAAFRPPAMPSLSRVNLGGSAAIPSVGASVGGGGGGGLSSQAAPSAISGARPLGLARLGLGRGVRRGLRRGGLRRLLARPVLPRMRVGRRVTGPKLRRVKPLSRLSRLA